MDECKPLPVSLQYMYARLDLVPAPSACMQVQYSGSPPRVSGTTLQNAWGNSPLSTLAMAARQGRGTVIRLELTVAFSVVYHSSPRCLNFTKCVRPSHTSPCDRNFSIFDVIYTRFRVPGCASLTHAHSRWYSRSYSLAVSSLNRSGEGQDVLN